VTRTGGLGKMLAVSSNQSMLQRNAMWQGRITMEYQIEDGERSGGSR
jgi:hypothetical protein